MSANGDDGHKSVEAAVANFLDETELTKKPKTLAAYSTALTYFRESCPRLFLEDIERKDLLKFCAFLRDEKKQAPRSVYNKFEIVMTFLKGQGIRGLVGKNDWPRFVEEEPDMYEAEDLDKLFAACDVEERLWYEFLLMTGMREQEVMYTYWSDINFGAATVREQYEWNEVKGSNRNGLLTSMRLTNLPRVDCSNTNPDGNNIPATVLVPVMV